VEAAARVNRGKNDLEVVEVVVDDAVADSAVAGLAAAGAETSLPRLSMRTKPRMPPRLGGWVELLAGAAATSSLAACSSPSPVAAVAAAAPPADAAAIGPTAVVFDPTLGDSPLDFCGTASAAAASDAVDAGGLLTSERRMLDDELRPSRHLDEARRLGGLLAPATSFTFSGLDFDISLRDRARMISWCVEPSRSFDGSDLDRPRS